MNYLAKLGHDIRKSIRPLDRSMEIEYRLHQLRLISGPLKVAILVGSVALWTVFFAVNSTNQSRPLHLLLILAIQAYLIFCHISLRSVGRLRIIAVYLTPIIPTVIAYFVTRFTILSLETRDTMIQAYPLLTLLIIVFYAFETISISGALIAGLSTSAVVLTGRLSNPHLTPDGSFTLWFHILMANVAGLAICLNGCITTRLQYKFHRASQRDRDILDSLVQRVFPQAIGKELRLKGGSNLARSYQSVTVLIADIANFTRITTTMDPKQLVTILHELFHRFDRLADQHGVEKIKTIGDAYMATAGCPVTSKDHAPRMAHFALQLMKVLSSFNKNFNTDFQIRVGIHTGPVVGGVISGKRISFDIWGETVNLTSRLQHVAEPGDIIISDDTTKILRGRFTIADYRTVDLKGLGPTALARLVSSSERNPFLGAKSNAETNPDVSELPFLSQH
jgi:class 3 adenylate cyclase